MIEKILVPLDGSPLAACVFAHVVTVAEATQAQVTLVSVLEKNRESTTPINPLDWQLRRVEIERYLEGIALHLSEFLETKPAIQVLEGSAAERIVEYAQKQAFDLIVLSSHGQGGVNGWNVSSVAQKVIQRCGKSILLVPAYRLNPYCDTSAATGIAYHRILAPLDGSQRAETALPVATALAQQAEAELYLVHVIARPEMMQRIPLSHEEARLADQLVERNQAQATHYLEQLQARLALSTQVQVMLNGHIAASLHKVVEQEHIDLIVLSAHGYSGNDRWPYGSVVTSFITYASVPLLILQDMPYQAIQASEAERWAASAESSWYKNDELSSPLNPVPPLTGNADSWPERWENRKGGENFSRTSSLKKLGALTSNSFSFRTESALSW